MNYISRTIESGLIEFKSNSENVGRGFKMIIQCLDECELNPCGYGKCSNTIGSFSCTCPDGFLQGEGTEQCQTCQRGFGSLDSNCKDEHTSCEFWASIGECEANPSYMLLNCKKSCNSCEIQPVNGTCQDIDECELEQNRLTCGYGSCSNYPGNFNCTCPDGFVQGEGTEQCQTCGTGFRPGELDRVVNLGKVADTWKGARDICSNYGDGSYTLPVPNSRKYHDFISKSVTGDVVIPLGFSDEVDEGDWINIYTSKYIIHKYSSLIIYLRRIINLESMEDWRTEWRK